MQGPLKIKQTYFNIINYNYENIVIHSPEEAVNIFNNCFVNVAINLMVCKFQHHIVERIHINQNSWFLENVSVNEIVEIINTLKNKTSAGEDNI